MIEMLLFAAAAAAPAPDWAGGPTYQYVGSETTIGVIAEKDRFAYGGGGNITANHSAIDTPATSRATNSTAVDGYSRCNGGVSDPFTNCVGILGVGLLGADSIGPHGMSGGAWGLNALAVNAQAAQAKDNSGFDFGFLGHELDVNVIAKRGGAAPTGNAIGLYLNGASQVQPSGLFNAVQVSSVGAAWKNGLYVEPGSASAALLIGAATRSGSSPSMPIEMFGRDEHGSNRIATLSADSSGNVAISPAAGVVEIIGAVQATAAYVTASLPVCQKRSIFTRAFVTDAHDAEYRVGAPLRGGGTNTIPAYCDGARWRAG